MGMHQEFAAGGSCARAVVHPHGPMETQSEQTQSGDAVLYLVSGAYLMWDAHILQRRRDFSREYPYALLTVHCRMQTTITPYIN